MFTDIVLMSLKYFGIFILTNLVLVFLISIILNGCNSNFRQLSGLFRIHLSQLDNFSPLFVHGACS